MENETKTLNAWIRFLRLEEGFKKFCERDKKLKGDLLISHGLLNKYLDEYEGQK